MLVFILMVSDLSQRVLDCYLLNSLAHFVIFIFYTDNQSDIINSQVNDSADRPTNLASPRNCQPASSGHHSELRTPTAKLLLKRRAVQGKFIQLISEFSGH